MGRGPLAGPVVAAAVILDQKNHIEGLADSKKLSCRRREELSSIIKRQALAWAIGRAEVEEIARQNGEGFVPGCNEVCLVIFIPKEGITQPVMIPLPVDCETGDCEETAWGRNSADSNDNCGNMPGGNWATYFVYGDPPQ